MAILSTLPSSTLNFIWNEKKQRYILTPTGFFNETGIQIIQGSITAPIADRLLDRLSLQIQNFIFEHTAGTNSKVWKKYSMANDDDFVEANFYAQVAQVEYYLSSAGPLISQQSGVSIEKSKTIPIERLRGTNRISGEAVSALEAIGLLYTGFYPQFPESLALGPYALVT
jgi:hypothetical protein